jgi:hypothetical protein
MNYFGHTSECTLTEQHNVSGGYAHPLSQLMLQQNVSGGNVYPVSELWLNHKVSPCYEHSLPGVNTTKCEKLQFAIQSHSCRYNEVRGGYVHLVTQLCI